MELNFKNVGKFADENSSRYECVINENFKVRVSKENYYEKGFTFSFVTISNYTLDEINGDFLSTFWSRATKKQAITRVKEILNDNECFTMINNHSIYIEKRMKDFINK